MKSKLKVMPIFGTRPEAIKMAPLVLELLKRSDQIETIVTVTAQHREMLDQVLDLFNINPVYDLDIMKANQTLSNITTRVIDGLDCVIKTSKPDIILVHGDTTTTFAASLSAYYNKIIVGHVEAGLRTGDKYSPFPEEINRQLTGVLSDLHFAPTDRAKLNLLNENKPLEQIYVTGNTAIDALKTTVTKDYQHSVLSKIADKKLILMTAHRRENIGENMSQMFRAIKRLVEKHQDIHVVYPVHLNPKVQEIANKILGENDRIDLIAPLDVIDFHNLSSRSHLILTDSGGVQEEAPSLGVPVLVLRDTTERPEGIQAGTLKLVGTNEDMIFQAADQLLSDDNAYEEMSKASNPYGDGKASTRIVDTILYYFKKTDIKPELFKF
ncbi:non-hydrolyzing UDP-N-acetylglucosamine 2-epimerase [Amphibacillus cookii]|uniref:non-hydrolyzing UDP-N-acetylglucosamine 2-epimerase n=1 Tax=Amphibacillus cookii TaxID=767787 RepID=UPI00195872B3|nr:UDP-N-acetylglucosamine 2-epimerase (non-hydrolyzing) [Amphibacillus cookii]MBM7543045.1 UDP-N-acetylglucosamine 2-epimerase (non-hydrolyzing) [Amphibacillus cookii]